MSMTEEEDAPPAPKAKKPTRKRRSRRAVPRQKAAPPAPVSPGPSYLDGMTLQECATGCGEVGCVLGTSYCAHPRKGGLQARDLTRPEAIERLNAAKTKLGHLVVELDRDR